MRSSIKAVIATIAVMLLAVTVIYNLGWAFSLDLGYPIINFVLMFLFAAVTLVAMAFILYFLFRQQREV